MHPIQAPADEGGGPDLVLYTTDAAVAIQVQGEETGMVHDERGDAHVQEPEDEGGGDIRAIDTHHGVEPAGGHEYHDGSPIQGGDGDEGPQDDEQDHGPLGGRHRQGGEEEDDDDKAVPDDPEGGEAVPTSDNTEAEDMKFMMSKISILARRGGGHNETCGCAHFILVTKAALLFPRSPC